MVEAGCEKYDEKFKVAGVYEEVYTKELKEKFADVLQKNTYNT